MPKAICLDTCILSQFLHGKTAAQKLIEEYEEYGCEVYTTTINITEFFMGRYKVAEISDETLNSLKDFFVTLHPRPVDYEIAALAGKLWATTLRGQEIGWRDTYIAAIVLLNGQSIVTSNIEHFKRVPGLDVIEYS